MRGFECRSNARSLNAAGGSRNMTSRALMDNLIIAGVGYSREDFSIKPQVLKSGPASSWVSDLSFTKTMTTASEYFSMVNPSDGQSVFNGLYSHSNAGIDLIFSKYFEGELYIVDSQKQFFTHSVNAPDIRVTDEFQQIIDILPEQMDWDMYNLVLTSFGDSIATSIKYGGIVDMTVSIRSCFNDPQMMQYISQELQYSIDGSSDVSKLPNGYVRYHKVSQLDIVGGNPQISNIHQRTATFAMNPVPVRLETIPIWRAFPDGPKQANMKKVYESYLQTRSRNVQNLINAFNAKREAEANNPQTFTAYKMDIRTNQLQKFGSSISLSKGQSGTITDDQIVVAVFGRTLLVADFVVGMQPVIHRNMDGTFFFDFNRGFCDNEVSNTCKITPGAVTWPLSEISALSTTGKNQCIQVIFQNSVRTRYSASAMYVCSGCMPVVSGKNISCNCPYVQ
ncbi:predicted protein [Naegleria gruberi]|uniref:Predicted protein n=1 Tax=Naegleria gruberi TaxID=5762 RepID=D2W295_NAEGR|nr:uncharacterized protein NAEGRDRAFT_75507 [Naegleria gruberi]EFC36825.1 predicted protein [Naegleria gruberi]|eukprot:XP_002669569.1 predicted protein [Naegleria gruberi strain NEG-M]